MLVCDRLCAGWGPTQVLDEVSLTIAAGETLIVLGRNGVGKSTLLSTIMGRSNYKSGLITMRGERIERQPSHMRCCAGIGLVPQEREIFPSLSVEENLLVASRPGKWTLGSIYELFPRLRAADQWWQSVIGWRTADAEHWPGPDRKSVAFTS
jgi:branched-chain amino acid transport system ATP-binding protein